MHKHDAGALHRLLPVCGVFICVGMLSGCLPIPHYERRASELNGVVRGVDGQPVAGMILKSVDRAGASRRACEADGELAVSDPEGRFHFPERRILLPMVAVIGDPTWSLSLCTANLGANQPTPLCYERIEPGFPPQHLRITCTVGGEVPCVCKEDAATD